MVLVAVVITLVTVNIILLTLTGKYTHAPGGLGRGTMVVVSPFQKALSTIVQSAKSVWYQYFFVVSTAEENQRLKKELAEIRGKLNYCDEAIIATSRLRRLLDFTEEIRHPMISAQVVGRDPSPWSKTIIVDKGMRHGVRQGLPVVVPEGIVGVVTDASGRFSKILLLIDPNSAVDGLVQTTRSRGIVKGTGENHCEFDYVLRKDTVDIGDVVVSSGLDGVFPKGLRVGRISEVMRMDAGIFQKVTLTPDVDFDVIEEVFIISQTSLDAFSDMP